MLQYKELALVVSADFKALKCEAHGNSRASSSREEADWDEQSGIPTIQDAGCSV